MVLIGVAGDPDGDSTVGPMAAHPPPRRAALGPAASSPAWARRSGRTRLMRIATETELGLHVDTNYYWWHHLRIHVPVRTTPDVVFQAGDESVHMAAGEVWVFDTWQRHRVDNPAASPRIHLVVDAVGSARTVGPRRAARPGAAPGRRPDRRRRRAWRPTSRSSSGTARW